MKLWLESETEEPHFGDPAEELEVVPGTVEEEEEEEEEEEGKAA